MSPENKKICPVCQGKKVVAGTCECDAEWRGTQNGEEWEECQCSLEQPCAMCKGTGFVDVDKKCS